MALEVALEHRGFLWRAKSDGQFNVPRFVFRGVWELARIVGVESFREVAGAAGVVAIGVTFAGQDVDVVEGCHSMCSIDGVDGGCPASPLATPWQFFFETLFRRKTGGREREEFEPLPRCQSISR